MKSISIAQAMAVVALVAANLALLRAAPWEFISFPALWSALGIVDFLLVWKGVLHRPLRAFHYTMLIVFVIDFIVLTYLASRERLRLLGPIVRWYQQMTGDLTRRPDLIHLGDIWTAAFLGLLIAWAAGLLASRLERNRGWDIAAFLRGALVGYGILSLIAVLEHAAVGPSEPSTIRLVVTRVSLAVCVILGGLTGLAKLRSDGLGGTEGESPVSATPGGPNFDNP